MALPSNLRRTVGLPTAPVGGSGRRSFMAGAMLWLAAAAAHAQTSALRPPGAPSEDSVKAAYLLKFLNYVEWPAASFAGDDAPYVIVVADDDGVLAELQRQTAGRAVNRRLVAVRRLGSGELSGRLHLLFVGSNDRARQAAQLRYAKGAPVLVVTDAEGALEQGSMINFRLVDERIRFEVALDPVKRAGLALNSRLLGVAIAVIKASQP